MKRNILIISISAIILIVILILAYPNFFVFKPYAHSGGLAGLPQDKICKCTGISYSYYPSGCNDCFTTFYCIGSLHDCKCLDIEEHTYSECD